MISKNLKSIIKLNKLIPFLVVTSIFAQNPQTLDNVTNINWATVNLESAKAPTTNIIGGIGPTTYYYWVVAKFATGNASPSPAGIANGALSPLSSTQYVLVAWPSVPNATGYDLLRTNEPRLPKINTAMAVTLNTTSTTFLDQGGTLTSYTINTAGISGGQHWTIGPNGIVTPGTSSSPTNGAPNTIQGNNQGTTQPNQSLTPDQSNTITDTGTTARTLLAQTSITPSDLISSSNNIITNLLLQQNVLGLPANQTGLAIGGTGNSANTSSAFMILPLGYAPWLQGLTFSEFSVAANSCSICLGYGDLNQNSQQITFSTFSSTNGNKPIYMHANSSSLTGQSLIVSPTQNPVLVPTLASVDGVPIVSFYGSASSSVGFSVPDPNNALAVGGLDWASDILRIRLAGSGTGASNGFQIQGAGNTELLGVDGNGNGYTKGRFSINNIATSIAGSTSGTLSANFVLNGPALKLATLTLTALTGTATYSFPTSFTVTPLILSTNGLASSVVTSLSVTTVTVTGAATTGQIILIGN